MAVKQVPRGFRNNNPLNIRIGNTWLGEVLSNTDGVFEQFVTMEYGIRAAFILLRRYINHYHLNTITQIVSRWAPMSENATDKYIAAVAAHTGFGVNMPLPYSVDYMVPLVDAMIKVECGTGIAKERIIKAFYMT